MEKGIKIRLTCSVIMLFISVLFIIHNIVVNDLYGLILMLFIAICWLIDICILVKNHIMHKRV